MTEGSNSDEQVERMISARGADSVIKLRLANLRAKLPRSFLLVFEGDDDKIIYSRWIGRVRPGLDYEPFPCRGKDGVRQLKRILGRDLGNLDLGVYFFVDRDFDDLRDFDNVEGLFMTDRYAVENYLVTSEVVGQILRDELPCDGEPEVREQVKRVFTADYDEFLRVTKEFNRKLFVARRLRIEINEGLPKKANRYANIELKSVSPASPIVESRITYKENPDASEVLALNEEFAALEPRTRYRGKNGLLFFVAWLTKLQNELKNPNLKLFEGINCSSGVRTAEFTIGGFASKSDLPVGFQNFLEAMHM